jgi:hypothetical protein
VDGKVVGIEELAMALGTTTTMVVVDVAMVEAMDMVVDMAMEAMVIIAQVKPPQPLVVLPPSSLHSNLLWLLLLHQYSFLPMFPHNLSSSIVDMKDPITFILNLFGYKLNKKDSLLYMHIMDVTHENWLGTLTRKNQLDKYKYNLYTY